MDTTDNRPGTGEAKAPTPDAAPGTPAGRDARGRFQKGGPSGNPRGRPVENLELKELCRLEGPASVRVIKAIRDDPTNDPQVRLAASKALLDRGFGRPETSVTVAI